MLNNDFERVERIIENKVKSVKFWQSLKNVIKCIYLPMSKLSAKSVM